MLIAVRKQTPWRDFWSTGRSVVVHSILVNTDAIMRIDRLKYGGSRITFLDGSKLKVSQEMTEFPYSK
jgi:hypothetical protein